MDIVQFIRWTTKKIKKLEEQACCSGSGSIAVEDEGVSILSNATTFNFIGAGVTVSDAGGNQVNITIPGGGGGGGLDFVTTTNSLSVNFTGNGTPGSPLSATVNFPAPPTIPVLGVNVPLYLDSNDYATLNKADGSNDGYLSSSDYTTIMNGILWEQAPVTISFVNYDTVRPLLSRVLNITNHMIRPNGSITYRQVASTSDAPSAVYDIIMSQNDQSVALGGRGLAYRKAIGAWTYSGFGESVAIGEFALGSITTGNRNTCVGKSAGYSITTGVQNTIIGANRTEVFTGSNNVHIGFGSSSFPNHTGNFNIAIGAGVNVAAPNSDNQLNIGNWIYGTDGRIGINNNAPTARLHVAAGTATANTAPIKLTTGVALTTPEDGAIEYNDSHLYFTIGSTRYQLDQQTASITGLWTPTTITTNTTLDATYFTVIANATSGNIAITLPAASAHAGRRYIIKKIDSSVNTVTYTTAEGAQTLSTQYAGNIIISDGTNWYVIGTF